MMIENVIAAVIVFLSLGFILFILVRAAGDRRSRGCGAGCACGMSCAQPSCPGGKNAGSDNGSPRLQR